jgi:hypothetical protein
MPDPSLITQLESLRDAYSQRQRGINALVSTLQNLNKAFNKAHKSLRDYAETTNAARSAPAALDASLGAFGETRLKEGAIDPLLPDLRREAKSLTGIVGALKDALAALRGESVDVVRLGKAYSALQGMNSLDETVRSVLPGLAAELNEAQNALGNTFGAALRDAFAEQGIEVVGRVPHLEIGRFEIVPDFLSRHASLSYGKEMLARRIPLSVEAVLKAYQRAEKDIVRRTEDGATWIRQFHDAWQAAKLGRGADLRANVVECYFEMVMLRQRRSFRATPSKSAFVDYSRAQFAFDLDQFVNRRRLDYKGLRPALHVAIKANTDNAEKSLWVVEGNGPHEGRYIGDVIFETPA